MAYYPQYGSSSPAAYPQYGLRHSSTANDASIAAAVQEEINAEATQRAPENTLRDSAMARALQAEEKLWSERTAAARGTFQVCKENVLISFRSSTNYDDKELNLPGVRFGDTLEGAAVDGSDGLVYVRVSAAGVQ